MTVDDLYEFLEKCKDRGFGETRILLEPTTQPVCSLENAELKVAYVDLPPHHPSNPIPGLPSRMRDPTLPPVVILS